MLAHLCLRHRTDSEGLQQQETIESLPKAIQSSISHFLFYSLVDQVYLFRGVSNDLLFQLVLFTSKHGSLSIASWILCFTLMSDFLVLKVTEMKAEYFPPKEDVILQNEAPTDLYILVTGAVVRIQLYPLFSTRRLVHNSPSIECCHLHQITVPYVFSLSNRNLSRERVD